MLLMYIDEFPSQDFLKLCTLVVKTMYILCKLIAPVSLMYVHKSWARVTARFQCTLYIILTFCKMCVSYILQTDILLSRNFRERKCL